MKVNVSWLSYLMYLGFKSVWNELIIPVKVVEHQGGRKSAYVQVWEDTISR